MEKYNQVIFDKNTVEFVTVAAEYGGFLKRAQGMKRTDFVETILKLLPLLYLKAALLPSCEVVGEDFLETFVTEADYEQVRTTLAELLGPYDNYADVCLPDGTYSDVPVCKCISEDLTDIYQDVEDFIGAFRSGLEVPMHDALATCREHFMTYWGKRLVDAMRALHEVRYGNGDENEKKNEGEFA